MKTRISLPSEQITDYYRIWQITELSLFGSVLRDDFRPDIDVEVRVRFHEDARHTLSPMRRGADLLLLVPKLQLRNTYDWIGIVNNFADIA
ncbi:nucleotidyltransferase [Desulfoglaeba alkanexedens]|uniref:Nucleotidyltransferase n=1 Tax=Desulfoglaeba alkanexedens ALDC TaxID=980445 RepID=A0A4P8L3C9_9BACT|nr:nucleotidyltransferase [Desulfoglaeba alkanexedens]QCQ22183.1 nucleotidyltransferase [Desulfoglaeba alkanexedens ALDC]